MTRIPCAFSVNRELLEQIDARAKSLGMTRSAYIVHVVRNDLLRGAADLNIVAESPPSYTTRPRKRASRKRAR